MAVVQYLATAQVVLVLYVLVQISYINKMLQLPFGFLIQLGLTTTKSQPQLA
jgi:hypothetical protein